MKIGLLGAPHSGKSALAQQLKDPLQELYGPTTIVDDYVEEISRRSDMALGHYATYVGNLLVAFGRFEYERKALTNADNTISCGTIIDTIAYNAIMGVVNNQSADGDQGRYQNYVRVAMSMEMLGVLYKDTFDYDHTFFLPLQSSKPNESEWDDKVNDNVLDALTELDVPHEAVAGNTEEQKNAVLDHLGEKKEKEVDEAEVSS